MFTKSAMPRLFAAAILSASMASAIASPVLVDFEGAPPLTLVGPTQPDQSYQESGVRFTPSGGDAAVDISYCAVGAEFCITNNINGVYLTALNGAEVTMSADRWFTLDSLDAAFYPTPSVNLNGYSFGLSLVGTLWGGGTVQATLSLLEDATPGDFLFSGYGGLGSAQLSSVTFGACVFDAGSCVRSGSLFSPSGLDFNDLEFAIDNLAVSIPEPSALWLVALGMAGVVSTRRRVTR